jgi:protein-S-isoprenylcysteine O-methyltransferase Ste14
MEKKNIYRAALKTDQMRIEMNKVGLQSKESGDNFIGAGLPAGIAKDYYKKIFIRIFKEVRIFITLLISISGFVAKHASIPRIVSITCSLAFYVYLVNYQPDNYKLAVSYFLISEALYIGFITLVLSKNGLRHWFIRKWSGEHRGYLAYEAALGFIFFHNASSIGYIVSSTQGNYPYLIHKELLHIILAIMVVFGFLVKIWSARAVSIDIYYWKDMFLGRRICNFVETGPYKYFNNPMYGVGQIQAYALAVWYGSMPGLIAVSLNQLLVFSFYFMVEKKFIERIYKNIPPA